MQGLSLHPLRRVPHPKGDIYHAIKASSEGFDGFGEAYFSTISRGLIKGWKKHGRMTLNLVVPAGEITFVIFDDRDASLTKGEFFEVTLGQNNYQRLTLSPNLWLAFEGKDCDLNLLLNVASIEHDPGEATNCDLDTFEYDWNAL